MFGKSLDDSTIDRLLNGLMHPEDAPPGLARTASLARAAKAPAQAAEMVGREHAISAVSAAVQAIPGIHTGKEIARLGRKTIGRKTMIGKLSAKLLSAKVASGIVAAAVVGGGAAAATGSLPASVQAPISSALSHVGISVPNPNTTSGKPSSPTTTTHTSTTTSTTTLHNSKAVGPNVNKAAAYGLCHAYAATKGNTSANDIAFRNLLEAAGKAGESVTAFCASVTPGQGSKPSGVGQPSGTGKPSGVGQPSGTGKPSGVGQPSGTGSSSSGSSSHPSGSGGSYGTGQPSGTGSSSSGSSSHPSGSGGSYGTGQPSGTGSSSSGSSSHPSGISSVGGAPIR
ncbi:MAG: hypothetical protein M1456_04495 [Actinobacteria bacterium]|nr:hypothetical protein [Actinomycetota bacterium]